MIQRAMAALFLVAVGFLCGFCLPKNTLEARSVRFGEAAGIGTLHVATGPSDSGSSAAA